MAIPFTRKLARGRFETWTITPPFPFQEVKQVHGVEIATQETLACEADGILSSWEDFKDPLAIKTADCLPILIEGKTGVVFLHAGWRGLAHGILRRPEIALIQPERAVIGPSIHKCCFEVSRDFITNFPDSPFFEERDGKFFFDLQKQAATDLRAYPGLTLEIASECTMCDRNFHSYRRDKPNGRNLNVFIKDEP